EIARLKLIRSEGRPLAAVREGAKREGAACKDSSQPCRGGRGSMRTAMHARLPLLPFHYTNSALRHCSTSTVSVLGGAPCSRRRSLCACSSSEYSGHGESGSTVGRRPQYPPPWFSVAPMMDWTDNHFRTLARLISKHAWLYTEMVVAETIVHQKDNLDRFLAFTPEQHPIVLQIGGSNLENLSKAAKLASTYCYDEINLNCGCPSGKVAGHGCFGARLMLDPKFVGEAMSAIAANCDVPVSVKCRIGVDDHDSYSELCETFVNLFMFFHSRMWVSVGKPPPFLLRRWSLVERLAARVWSGSVAVKRGGVGLAVSKALFGGSGVGDPGCSIPTVCLPTDVAIAVRVATSKEASPRSGATLSWHSWPSR
ncbi:hypothetical protein Taro_051176, partial [Colocasia esculenta]|nr:hypothetical protein [Colocasia esculenta]